MDTHVFKEPGKSLCNKRVAFYNLVNVCDAKLVTCEECLRLCKQEEMARDKKHQTPITVVNIPFSPVQVRP